MWCVRKPLSLWPYIVISSAYSIWIVFFIFEINVWKSSNTEAYTPHL